MVKPCVDYDHFKNKLCELGNTIELGLRPFKFQPGVPDLMRLNLVTTLVSKWRKRVGGFFVSHQFLLQISIMIVSTSK